jgi:protein involved in polysaccharide export with SLBB domain
LTVSAAQGRLRQTLGARYSSSELRLTLGQTRTIQVNVMGEVQTPGTYHLSAFSSVFHALYKAGGIRDLGTLRNIRVIRGGKVVTTVDVYDYILNGRLTGNILLKEDDVIQVQPYENLVGISGNVKRPMFYELKKNETLSTLISFAGGFTSDAYKKSIRVVRQAGELYSVHNVSEFDQATFKMADGDAVTVDGMLNRFENMVEIKGAVFRPGQYRIGQQVTTVRTLIEQAEGLTEDAFTARAVLHRLKAD